ncbi:hypothetical protein Tco_0968242 [Tanacetum coccineum]
MNLVRRVTCGYPWPELEGKGLWYDPRAIEVLAVPSYFHKKFRWGTVFAIGRRKKMTIKEVRGESVMKWKIKVTTKEGIVIKFPGKFRGCKLTTEEEVEENKGLKEV